MLPLHIRITATILITALLTACATHRGPTARKGESAFLFVTDDEAAIFQAAYDAMLDGRRESPIYDIDGPVRGYTLTQKWALDYWTSNIRVLQATGLTKDGTRVSGYYPEVSGEGTLIIRGPSMDKRIYESALARMSTVAKKIDVTELARGTYSSERDQWRLNQSPSLREGSAISVQGLPAKEPSGRAVSDRVKELDTLKGDGKISDAEYVKLREKILQDL